MPGRTIKRRATFPPRSVRASRRSILRCAVPCLGVGVILVKVVAMLWGHSGTGDYNSRQTAERVAAEVAAKKMRSSTALLVTLRDNGPTQDAALEMWSRYAGELADVLPPVWILCTPNSTIEEAVRLAPNMLPFSVDSRSSWAEALEQFLGKNEGASIVGLFGEGSLPHSGLSSSIRSVYEALEGSTAPTAVVARSRSSRTVDHRVVVEGGEWLADTLVAQVWCNREMLAPSRLADLEVLPHRSVYRSTLLSVVPAILEDPSDRSDPSDAGGGGSVILVDGTPVLKSVVSVAGLPKRGRDYSPASSSQETRGDANAPSDAEARSSAFYIGTLENALVIEEDTKIVERDDGRGGGRGTTVIAEAPWPPSYVLETVATERGMILVTSVNCGYLDMAVNFLRSVRNVVDDVKILFVAMDEVSFNFMDAVAPGCTVMFPSRAEERPHAVKAGEYGDKTFSGEVLIRPRILRPILRAGYTVLWTDSDMVWRKNPLPLLPDIDDPLAAEVMLQLDGSEGNKCTCFMFLKPTDLSRTLVDTWEQNIISERATRNQPPFKRPLLKLQDAGLRVEIISETAMPAGKELFDGEELGNYKMSEDAVIVHNNWIMGHDEKKKRFQRHDLWYVDDLSFPTCGLAQDDASASGVTHASGFVVRLVCAASGLWLIWANNAYR